MKTVIIKANDKTSTVAENVVVTQDGQPTIIQAIKQVNYELIDQDTGYAPNHIVTTRDGEDLQVSFEEDSTNPDLIIEGFYNSDDSALIGMAEDGSYYYYVPDTAEVADYVTELQPGDIEGQALGGEPQAAPWWMGASDGFNALPWLVGLAGVGAAAALISNDDDDDNNNDSGTVVDSDAPDAPTLNVNEDGTAVTGEAEAGSTVEIDVDGDGDPDYSTTADEDGGFTIEFDEPLSNGETVTGTATDEAGNESGEAETTAPDSTVPNALSIEINDDGAEITGSSEPNSTIEVDVDGDGEADYTTTADENGDFTIDISEDPLTNGETVTGTATDEAGNDAGTSTVTAPAIDGAENPDAPTINVSEDGTQITGKGAPRSLMRIDVDGDGEPDYTTTADENGDFTIDISGKPINQW